MISNMLNLSESMKILSPDAAVAQNSLSIEGEFMPDFSTLISDEVLNMPIEESLQATPVEQQTGGNLVPDLVLEEVPEGKVLPPAASFQHSALDPLVAGLPSAALGQPSQPKAPAEEVSAKPVQTSSKETVPVARNNRPIAQPPQPISKDGPGNTQLTLRVPTAEHLAILPERLHSIEPVQGSVSSRVTEPREGGLPTGLISGLVAKTSADRSTIPIRPSSQEPLSPILSGTTVDPALPQTLPGSAPQTGGTPSVQPAGLSPPAHIQLDTLIDNLVDARESGRAARGDMLMRHAEFGSIAVRFDQTDSDLLAKLSSRDPAFAAAAQTALNERAAIAATSDTSTNQQRGQEHTGPAWQSRDSAMADSGNRGSDQRAPHAQSGAKASDHNQQPQQKMGQSQSGQTPASGGGRFA